MGKKHQEEKLAAKLAKAELAKVTAAKELAERSSLQISIDDIDGLLEDKKYLQALDRICVELGKSDSSSAYFEKSFVSTIHGICNEPLSGNDPPDIRALLSTAQSQVVQLAVAGWLRATTANASFPNSPELERAFADAIDKSMVDVFQRHRIDLKAQSFQKRQLLNGALVDLENEFRTLLGSPVNINVLGTLRQSFMKPFKTPLSQTVVWPFLPIEMRSEARLASLFQAVSELVEAGPDELMDAFKNTSEVVRTFSYEASQHSTTYSKEILEKLADRIQASISEFMDASPLAKPAKIIVSEVKKRYPLTSVGTTLRATFLIQNMGPGSGREVLFKVDDWDTQTLRAEKTEWYLGVVGESKLEIAVPLTVVKPTQDSVLMVSVAWKNYDHSEDSQSFVFDLLQQRTDVDWEQKKFLDPYSLEPVERESDLVGRSEILEELSSLAYARSVGSCYLYGQKRVGKTSVVKTLRDKLEKSKDPRRPTVIYLERGQFGGADPIVTIENLGNKLCEKLSESDPRFRHLELPTFKDALVPLNNFLDSIVRIAPEYRALFILDEFDELPIGLYRRTDIGDAFFGSLRSMTNKPEFGLVLVGSENMRHVIHLQGHALNKFQTIELDYFDRNRHWGDFQELVRRPVAGVLDVEDDAIVDLYEATSGNPFFTKLVCGRLFKTMVRQRDCHVTRVEMGDAAYAALRQDMGINKVQHFWSDGIFEIEAKHEAISLRRRKILLSLAYAARKSFPIQRADVVSICAEKFGLEEDIVDSELLDLSTTRKIVKAVGGNIEFKIPFFLRWLIDSGIDEIIAVSIDADASLRRSHEEELARIRPEEIVEVTNGLQGGYKGRQISEDLIRTWLHQFGDHARQRLAFMVLQGMKFYSQAEIRAKVREAHGMVSRHLVRMFEKGKLKRGDILVSYLDGPGKSGARYAKLYADENDIYSANVVELSELGRRLKKDIESIEAVVFVDDLVGTGKSAASNFETLARDQDVMACRDKVKMFFMAICGLEDGIVELERRIGKLPLQIEVHVCDHLDDRDRVFSDRSRFFKDLTQRHEALALFREIGTTLEKKQPLGYGDTQLAVIFEDTAPNNSLPVLWKRKRDWTALFPRD